jgi:uncharacterized membrane protein
MNHDDLAAPVLLEARSRTSALDVIERFLWTFLQAGIGSLPATLTLAGDDLRAVGYSALTAGIAAVISLAKSLAIKAQTTG